VTSTLAMPFGQHVQYAPGTIGVNNRTQVQLDDDIRAFYNTWKSRYIVSAGTSPAGIPMYPEALGTDPSKTTSEGMGFAMAILPLMAGQDPDAQKIFDGLWEYARQHPSGIESRLMTWIVPVGTQGNDSAFDGDADMAFGLLLADKQWGSSGRVNY